MLKTLIYEIVLSKNNVKTAIKDTTDKELQCAAFIIF